MAYTFDAIFAVDPANPANVAKNAAITIFNPADVNQSPITITDPTGSPLPNPITLDAAGMGPAFQHPTLARVGWKGAGFTGYFTSYEGMLSETIAAKSAAATSATAATASAASAQAAANAVGGFVNTGITYNSDGTVATVTEAGVTTTYTYNADGTVATDTRLGVTRAYTYTNGNLTGIEAV